MNVYQPRKLETHVARLSERCFEHGSDQANSRSESQEWEIVTRPEAPTQTPYSHGRRMSSHFDLQLGWGTWKFKLFSWDVDFRRYQESGGTSEAEERRTEQGSVEERK